MKIFSSIFTGLLVLALVVVAGMMASSYFQKIVHQGANENTEITSPSDKPDIKPDRPNEDNTKPEQPTPPNNEANGDVDGTGTEQKPTNPDNNTPTPEKPDDTTEGTKPEEKPTLPDNSDNTSPSQPDVENGGGNGGGNTGNVNGENNENVGDDTTKLNQPNDAENIGRSA